MNTINMKEFYNCHIHTFVIEDVPERFLPLRLVRFLTKRRVVIPFARFLNSLYPDTDNDQWDRYAQFLKYSANHKQTELLDICKSQDPCEFIYCIITMDMEYQNAGRVPRPYISQVEELAMMAKKDSSIRPVLHIDPRRPDIMKLLALAHEEWNYIGVKIYPPLGYLPSDPRLFPVYEYCVKNEMPVFSHCCPSNPVRIRRSSKLLETLSSDYKTARSMKRNDLCALLTHPKRYIPVLKEFPELKLCLSHFGSDHWDSYKPWEENPTNWVGAILNMMSEYKFLYADISSTLGHKEFIPQLNFILSYPEISNRILFGTDFYMSEIISDEKSFVDSVINGLGQCNWSKIAHDNPRAFLGKYA